MPIEFVMSKIEFKMSLVTFAQNSMPVKAILRHLR